MAGLQYARFPGNGRHLYPGDYICREAVTDHCRASVRRLSGLVGRGEEGRGEERRGEERRGEERRGEERRGEERRGEERRGLNCYPFSDSLDFTTENMQINIDSNQLLNRILQAPINPINPNINC